MAKLAEYRWLLRLSANSAPFMRYAVGVLDACSQLLEEHAGTPRDGDQPEDMQEDDVRGDWTAQGGTGDDGPDQAHDDYLEDPFVAFLMNENMLTTPMGDRGDWLQAGLQDFD
jgi:hypothetical protein